jgi:hypothetical protein
VVHSDTLEHVFNPIRALEECRRVLRPGAALCFTIPTVVERLSRSRERLSKSYHGTLETCADDYVVHTEFGADMWTYVLRAGFSALSINAVDLSRSAGPKRPEGWSADADISLSDAGRQRRSQHESRTTPHEWCRFTP